MHTADSKSNPRHHPHLHPLLTTTSQRQFLNPLPTIPILHPLKLLHQPHNRVARLCQRKVLANTNPRSAVEREVSPPWTKTLPSFWAELEGVFPVDVLAAVQVVGVVGYDGVFGYEDGGEAIRSSASREDGVAEGEARVHRDHGVEAECLVVLDSVYHHRRWGKLTFVE